MMRRKLHEQSAQTTESPSVAATLEEMVKLTHAQTEALDNDQFELLNQLTTEKQTLIEQLKVQQAGPFARPLRPEIKRTLMQLSAMEKYNIRLSTQKESALGTQLSKMISGRAALRQYAPLRTSSRHVDKAR